MRHVCDVAVEPDGLVFDAKTIQGRKIKEDADYEGVREVCGIPGALTYSNAD